MTATPLTRRASGAAARPAAPAPRRPRTPGTHPARTILVTGILVVVALYFLVPVYWVVVAASKTSSDLFATPGLLFSGHVALWDNITRVFGYGEGIFGRWLLNSVLYAGVGAIIATYVAAAGGYALAKYSFRGRDTIYAAILGGVLVPGTATALPLFLLFSSIGLSNTYWAVLLPSLVSPFGLFLCQVYARTTIDDGLIEAARLDGAGELRIFHTVGLRILTPALVTVFLFQLVGIWNNYFLPLVMLSDEKLYPVTLGLQNWNSQITRLPEFYELTTAGVLLSIIPLAIAMVVLQRFWRGGLTEGSIK
ncbi:carbohydrate ABC transporter permease [Mycetocola saprophilus]|uniref:carbohydrate ABC transporter permease n=1 Tax=Mycetocola saprophilus TaxID=76636 RepID=UPI0004BF8DC4|nr:carbohydrate ABC transporter permease [Mycetocola saprophilus]